MLGFYSDKDGKTILMLTIIWTDWVDGSNSFNMIAIGILPIWINEITNFVGIGNAGDRNGLISFYIIWYMRVNRLVFYFKKYRFFLKSTEIWKTIYRAVTFIIPRSIIVFNLENASTSPDGKKTKLNFAKRVQEDWTSWNSVWIPCRYYHIYDMSDSLNMQSSIDSYNLNNCILTSRISHFNNYSSDLMFTFMLFCFTEALWIETN